MLDEGAALSTASYSMTVQVTPVNDAPSFSFGNDPFVMLDSGPQSFPNWATNITPGGGPDESSQALTFILTPTVPSLFSVAPSLDISGTLSFTPAPGAAGSTEVQIVLHDSGGVANGGQDSSPVWSFSITISAAPPGESRVYLPLVTR